ncbi:30S ribosome-binding factor RbfA [Spiroplasma endosymbiont of Villa modesta]|uniref:30S ribosome-binding factor RbfA n=1 Tax=Spiroplasma endosymbiont of Villa modesta TaxID=3066293 RepID=UPI00313DAFDB
MSIIKFEQQESFLKKEITNILKKESKNILFKDITITNVKITKDNSYATIYWTVYLENLDIKTISNALEKAKGFCRSALAKTSNKYKVPELRFKYDNTNTRVKNIEEILKNIKNNISSNE